MMSVKKMIELYVNYSVDEETWEMLYSMVCHGLISRENWIKFYDTCASWIIEGNTIIDGDGNVIYMIDDNGYWKKVA